MADDGGAFAAPEADAGDPSDQLGLFGLTTDGLLSIAFAMLLVAAVLAGGLCVLALFAGIMGLVADVPTSPGDPPLAVIGLVEFALFLIPTALYGFAATGVFMRTKWGWILAMLGFALTMGGCCAPFGLFGMYALLREPGRKAFGM